MAVSEGRFGTSGDVPDATLVPGYAIPRVTGTGDAVRCASPVEGDATLEGRAAPLREGIAAY